MNKMTVLAKTKIIVLRYSLIIGLTLLAFMCGVVLNQNRTVQATSIPNEAKPGVDFSGDHILSRTNNGIEVKVSNFRKHNNFLSMDVCFSMLDDSDWTIGRVVLDYGGGIISDHSTLLLERQSPSYSQLGYRCDELSFDVQNNSVSSFTVTIETLRTLPRENEFCTSYLENLNKKLKEQGIIAECETVENFYSLKVASKPEKLSKKDAEMKVFSEDYYSTKGPWMFSKVME